LQLFDVPVWPSCRDPAFIAVAVPDLQREDGAPSWLSPARLAGAPRTRVPGGPDASAFLRAILEFLAARSRLRTASHP